MRETPTVATTMGTMGTTAPWEMRRENSGTRRARRVTVMGDPEASNQKTSRTYAKRHEVSVNVTTRKSGFTS